MSVNDKPIHILHVTRLPITVTAFLMPLLSEHRSRGERVSVACSDGPEIAAIEAEGFQVHRFRLRRNLRPWNLARALRGLSRIVRGQQVDWVFTHTPIASSIARLASRMGRAKGTVYMAHGLSCAPRIPRHTWLLWYRIERVLGRITEGLITTNSYDYELAGRASLIPRAENIYRVNEVGVDAARFDRLVAETDAAAVKRELGLSPAVPMILMLAWTLPTKGVREFLEAARLLVQQRVEGNFVLGGHGPLDAEIAEYIRSHGLGERVFHLGWRRDAHRLMAACDVYVLPTYYPEGMPVSILEAMACGKPVVATRHRGCEDEVVHGQTGLLVEPMDPMALAAAIRTLIEDPNEAGRFGQAGRRRIDQGFRTEQCTRAIIDAFDKIITDRAARHRGPEPFTGRRAEIIESTDRKLTE